MVRCVVGADVPAARVAVCVLGGVPWARRAEDVAPYHVFGMVRCVVGADVPAARVPVCGMVRCVVGADVPAARVPVFGMVRCVVGADVLGGPRARVRPRRCPLGAARVPPVYRFQKKRTKMLHEGRFGLAPSIVL